MAILIDGLDMPEQGEFKHLRIYDNGDVTVEVGDGEAVIAHAVPAAAGTRWQEGGDVMEYIEKEKAARILREEAAAHYPTAFHVGLYAAARAIDSIPAADVRPVVRAKWVYTDMSRLVCSNCGNPVAFALKEGGWHHGDFCPNCGAKMEESNG